eukprot:15458919-Alexandrium_andersonii.AAC.1
MAGVARGVRGSPAVACEPGGAPDLPAPGGGAAAPDHGASRWLGLARDLGGAGGRAGARAGPAP